MTTKSIESSLIISAMSVENKVPFASNSACSGRFPKVRLTIRLITIFSRSFT